MITGSQKKFIGITITFVGAVLFVSGVALNVGISPQIVSSGLLGVGCGMCIGGIYLALKLWVSKK